ncbi:unnamed protein product, partial [Meganyctiphanes norvegica]
INPLSHIVPCRGHIFIFFNWLVCSFNVVCTYRVSIFHLYKPITSAVYLFCLAGVSETIKYCQYKSSVCGCCNRALSSDKYTLFYVSSRNVRYSLLHKTAL